MKTVQAKFKVTEVTQFLGSVGRINPETQKWFYNEGNCERVKFSIVGADKPENEVFAMYSPYGNMEMVINNESILGHFKLGKEYIFSISPAE